MDEDGCNGVHGHGGKEKQDKQRPKWVCRACFCMYGHRAKMQHVGMDGHGDQGGARGAKEGEQRVCSPRQIRLESKKARN